MNTLHKNLIKKTLFILTLCFWMMSALPAHAQISFDDDVDDETPAAPIDGLLGLGIAAAAGAWYGIRKIRGKGGS